MLRNLFRLDKVKYFFCTVFVLSLLTNVNAQGVKVTYSHNLSTNPFKIAMGLINLEYEYVLSDQVTVRISTEFMIGDRLFFRSGEHPKLFTDLGVRYYLKNQDEFAIDGLFIGTSFGHIYMNQPGSESSLTLGLESGYRFNIPENFYLTPKVSGYYQIKNREMVPGAELRVGTSF